jgi:hypothetical protein
MENNTRNTLGQIAIDFGKSSHDLEMSLMRVSREMADYPVVVAEIAEILTSLRKLRKSIADLAYDNTLHCENCYESDHITEKLDNCELCFECLVGTNDDEHFFRCWQVHQAY